MRIDSKTTCTLLDISMDTLDVITKAGILKSKKDDEYNKFEVLILKGKLDKSLKILKGQ